MKEREWREFFGLPDNIATSQGAENKFLFIFYIALTVLFLDLFYFLHIGARIETLTWAIIPSIYTIGIIPLGIVCIKINKPFNSPFPYWRYQSIITGLLSILFIYLSVAIMYSKKISFAWTHAVIYIISVVLIILALIYRYIKLKNCLTKSVKKRRKSVWIVGCVPPLTLLVVSFLKAFSESVDDQLVYLILSMGTILVGGIFCTISLITIQNIYFSKKYKVFGE